MNTTEARRRAWCAAAALLCTLLALHAAHASRGITTTGNMAFGRFAAGTGGSVVVSVTGARSKTGGVILLNSSGVAASFDVDAAPGKGKMIIISLPSNGSVLLTNGTSNMTVNNFVSNAPANGQLNVPAFTMKVGATLQVGTNQQAGNYAGTFPVIVEYQ